MKLVHEWIQQIDPNSWDPKTLADAGMDESAFMRPTPAPSDEICWTCGSYTKLRPGTPPMKENCSTCNQRNYLRPKEDSRPIYPPLKWPKVIRNWILSIPLQALKYTLITLQEWWKEVIALKDLSKLNPLITPPIHSGNDWVWYYTYPGDPYYDCIPHLYSTAPSAACPLYSYDKNPSSRLTMSSPYMLSISTGPYINVTSTWCKICGRPFITEAQISGHSWTGSFPLMCCLSTSAHPLLTKELAARSGSWIQDEFIDGIIPTRIHGTEDNCYRTRSPYLGDLRQWIHTPEEEPSPEIPGTRMISLNIGGWKQNSHYIEELLRTLRPGIFIIQETWDDHTIPPFLIRLYHVRTTELHAKGKGLMIAVARSLVQSPEDLQVLHVSELWLSVLCQTTSKLRLLITNVHIRPNLPYKDSLTEYQHIGALSNGTEADVKLLAGDFNDRFTPGTALHTGHKRYLHRYMDLLPPGTPTNVTNYKGTRRETAIDRIFIEGKTQAELCTLLPSPSTHHALMTTLKVDADTVDPYSWKTLKWRRASDVQKQTVATHLDILWGILALTKASPQDYHHTFLQTARQILGRPQTSTSLLKKMSTLRPPYTRADLQQVSTWMQEVLQSRREKKDMEILTSPQVTSATKSLFLGPSASLKPIQGLKPSSEAELGDPHMQMSEIFDQFKQLTEDSHVSLDYDWFKVNINPTEHSIDGFLDLPHEILTDMLQRNLNPDLKEDRVKYSQYIASQSLLHDPLLATQVTKPGSDSTSIDQMPQSLLQKAGGGMITGVRTILQQSRAGITSIWDQALGLSINKNKGLNHIMKGHRPITLEGALRRKEAALAARKSLLTLEAGNLIPTNTFGYRPGIRPHYMLLAMRAALQNCLLTNGICYGNDWDQEGAFVQIHRSKMDPFFELLKQEWNGAKWAHAYYSRYQIQVATPYGFTERFTPPVSLFQGDDWAAIGYLTWMLLATKTLRAESKIQVNSIEAANFIYSDDMKALQSSLPALVRLVKDMEQATQNLGGRSNAEKLDFFKWIYTDGEIQQTVEQIPELDAKTTSTHAKVLGVPLLGHNKPSNWIKSCILVLRQITKRTQAHQAKPLIATRAFQTLCLSKIDYVFAGVLLKETWIQTLQKHTASFYRRVWGLPVWASHTYMALPLEFGGLGMPQLIDRNHCLLLGTYLHGALSRNNLTRNAVADLLLRTEQGLEGERVQQRNSDWLISIHFLGDAVSTLSKARVYTEGSLVTLKDLNEVIVAVDGSQHETRIGASAVLYHPLHGVIFAAYTGCHVVGANSTQAEWMAKILAIKILGHWKGSMKLVTDSTASIMGRKQRLPRKETLLDRMLRNTLREFPQRSIEEFWMPAAHDSLYTHTLAELNHLADHFAGRGANLAQLNSWPYPRLLGNAVVASHLGCILEDPSRALAELYTQRQRHSFEAKYGNMLNEWDGTPFKLLVEDVRTSRELLSTAMLYRYHTSLAPPNTVHGLHCNFCGKYTTNLPTHFEHQCPQLYLRFVSAAWSFIRLLYVQLHLRHGTFALISNGTIISTTDNTLQTGVHLFAHRLPIPPVGHSRQFLTLSGLWSETDACLLSKVEQKQQQTLQTIQILSKHTSPDLTLELQPCYDLQASPINPSFYTALAIHHETLSPPRMSLTDSVVLSYILRGIEHWLLYTDSIPVVDLPLQPPPVTPITHLFYATYEPNSVLISSLTPDSLEHTIFICPIQFCDTAQQLMPSHAALSTMCGKCIVYGARTIHLSA